MRNLKLLTFILAFNHCFVSFGFAASKTKSRTQIKPQVSAYKTAPYSTTYQTKKTNTQSSHSTNSSGLTKANINNLDSSKLAEKKSPFSISMDLSYSENMYEGSQYEKTKMFNLRMIPVYQINANSSINALTNLSHDLKAKEDMTHFSSTLVTWKFTSWKLSSSTSLSPNIAAILPTNSVQNKNEKFQGGAGIGLGLTSKNIFNIPMNIKLIANLRKNVHEYTTTAEGAELIEYATPIDLTLDYQVTKKSIFPFSVDIPSVKPMTLF